MISKILVLFMLVFFVSSDGMAQNEPKYDASLIKRFYSMGTASVNGTYYPLGNAISKLFAKKMKKMVCIPESTAGSLANAKYLKNQQIDLALMQSDVAWAAYNGFESFSGNSFKELRVIASLYSEKVQIVVKADSDIKTLADLRGKKIAVGDKESGSAAGAVQIFEAAGLKADNYELVYQNFIKSTENLFDGYVDAVYYVGGAPADGITRLASKTPIRLIQIPYEIKTKLMKEFPYYSDENIAANSYKGQLKNVETLGFKALLTCKETMSENEVYTLLSVIYNNPKLYNERNELLIEVNPEDGLSGFDEKMLHSGAAKYFKHNRK